DFRIVLVTDAVGNASEEGIRELGRMGIYLMPSQSCLDWLVGAAAAAA
ncbi:MAG: hypothetical protein IH900_15970, partial [Proteobacteria bacterium]|nr:hypothetical protein [Pseudomonadota bacterium]